MFCPACTASSRLLSIGTWLIDCNPYEGNGWPGPSKEMGKKEGGFSSKVSVRGMTSSPSLSKHASRSEHCNTNPPVKELETGVRPRGSPNSFSYLCLGPAAPFPCGCCRLSCWHPNLNLLFASGGVGFGEQIPKMEGVEQSKKKKEGVPKRALQAKSAVSTSVASAMV